MSVSSLLSTTIESSGISVTLRFSMDFSGLLGLCAKDAKGTAKKARTINATIFFIIHFPPIDNNAGSPSRVPYVKNAIGALKVVNSRYSFSCEINTNYSCSCNRSGEDRLDCYRGLKIVCQPLLRFSLRREWKQELYDGSRAPRASCGLYCYREAHSATRSSRLA